VNLCALVLCYIYRMYDEGRALSKVTYKENLGIECSLSKRNSAFCGVHEFLCTVKLLSCQHGTPEEVSRSGASRPTGVAHEAPGSCAIKKPCWQCITACFSCLPPRHPCQLCYLLQQVPYLCVLRSSPASSPALSGVPLQPPSESLR
jgi:hypothetical protein